MKLSIHYYILSLGSETSRLYEGFRDELIDIQNTAFPFHSSSNGPPRGHTASSATRPSERQLRDFLDRTDLHFAQYFGQDPLGVILVGPSEHLEIFSSLTRHHDVIVGMVRGDFSETSPHDLGKIVWPIVKIGISGRTDDALRSLAAADVLHSVVAGIDDVWLSSESNPGSTLYVEDDYHVKTSEAGGHNKNAFLNSIALRELFNDVVDIIIEKILRGGGAVIFMENGSLVNRDRIAMVLRT